MKPWLRRTLVAFGVLIVIESVAAVIFHRRDRPVIDRIRRWNRRYLNPGMLHLAGRKGWYASSIHHRGRSSGRSYETPIVAHPAPGGFLIPLPYGDQVDWLRNLQAAGGGSLLHHGDVYRVTRPRVVERDIAFASLSGRERLRYQFYGIDRFLHLDAGAAMVHALHGTG